jgi:PEP-CTERM motif
MKLISVVTLGFTALGAVTQKASADTLLPPPTYSIIVGATVDGVSQFRGANGSSSISTEITNGFAAATGSITSGLAPREDATVGVVAGDVSASVAVFGSYSFEIVGPVFGAPVNVRISSAGQVPLSVNPQITNVASLQEFGFANNPILGSACSDAGGDSCGRVFGFGENDTFSSNTLETLSVGTQYTLAMSLNISIEGSNGVGPAKVSGFLDPSVIIDPAFPNAGDYSVLLSSDVPEPSTWAMLLLGFAGIGFIAYQSRGPAGGAGVEIPA